MRSWKQRKMRDERMKARRRGKQRFARSVCFVDTPPRQDEELPVAKTQRLGFLEKIRRSFQRRILRKKI